MLGGGILTITRRNAVHSAISLIVSLLGVAGLYLLQQAEFLFAVQIVLYVGGIMVLFLFVIMLVNLDQAAHEAPVQPAVAGGAGGGGGGGRRRSATSCIAAQARSTSPKRGGRRLPAGAGQYRNAGRLAVLRIPAAV